MGHVGKCDEKFKTLFEASKFLFDVLQEPLVAEMKEQVLVMRQHMEEIRQAIGVWRQEASQQGRLGYQDLVARIKAYLDKVDVLLKPLTVDCRLADVRKHMQDIEVNS